MPVLLTTGTTTSGVTLPPFVVESLAQLDTEKNGLDQAPHKVLAFLCEHGFVTCAFTQDENGDFGPAGPESGFDSCNLSGDLEWLPRVCHQFVEEKGVPTQEITFTHKRESFYGYQLESHDYCSVCDAPINLGQEVCARCDGSY